MLLTNHTLTGIALGLAIDNPLLLAPTAVASHLALDALPHFGHPAAKNGPETRAPLFLIWGTLDVLASATLVITACLTWPHRLVPILVGSLGATLPDLVYIPLVVFGTKLVYRFIPVYQTMIRFLARIQWYERPPGLITEIIWAGLMLAVLRSQLN